MAWTLRKILYISLKKKTVNSRGTVLHIKNKLFIRNTDERTYIHKNCIEGEKCEQ